MKLSEAILEGCKITKPAKGVYIDENFNGDVCACVWGAAYFAIHRSYKIDADRILDKFPESQDDILWNNSIYGLRDLLFLWNDIYGYKRERIADWLQEIGY